MQIGDEVQLQGKKGTRHVVAKILDGGTQIVTYCQGWYGKSYFKLAETADTMCAKCTEWRTRMEDADDS